jgi:hypothetical protein
VDVSPVKLTVIGIMLLVGVITLATAFEGGTPTVPTTAEVSPSPVPDSSASAKPPKDTTDSGSGVQLGLYNGTTQSGLAAEVGRTLSREGYVPNELGNTVDLINKTVVYFAKPADQASAELLADNSFPGAPVQAKPADLQVVVNGNETSPSRSAQVLVMIGADYAG